MKSSNLKTRLLLLWISCVALVVLFAFFSINYIYSNFIKMKYSLALNQAQQLLHQEITEGNYFKVSAKMIELKRSNLFEDVLLLTYSQSANQITVLYQSDDGLLKSSLDLKTMIRFCAMTEVNETLPGMDTIKFAVRLPDPNKNHCVLLVVAAERGNDLLRIKKKLILLISFFVIMVISILYILTMQYSKKILEIEKNEVKMQYENERIIINIAKQVAHDIRSPLAALNSVLADAGALAEDTRLIMRSAIARINDIANHLLFKKGAQTVLPDDKSDKKKQVYLISALIDQTLSEKRIEYRSKIGIEIIPQIDSSAYGIFAAINASDFKRIISNLINNAVEALKEKGTITISFEQHETDFSIKVSDNGAGMPPEMLEKLGQRGFTNKASGSGIGIHHAKETVRAWDGEILYESEPRKGTTVWIKLPMANAPSWFAPRIDLTHVSNVILVDDDISIHQIWKSRLPGVKTESFVDLTVFKTWLAGNQKSDSFFLIDYEFLGNKETGLDAIIGNSLQEKSFLVTSRFEEPEVIARCENHGVKIIPKGMAVFVPIILPLSTSDDQSPDAILIDDDPIVRLSWKVSAKKNKKNLKIFNEPNGFFEIASTIKKDTPVYIDSNLADNLKGEEVARKIYVLGFCNIYLATGMDACDFPPMDWIKAITGKQTPWS